MTNTIRTILKFEYGSTAHGTNTVDSDHDFMGVFVESPEFVTGIQSLDTIVEKTAVGGARSTAIDTDTTLYPLRKWASLASRGNPTVLTAFFAPVYEIRTFSGNLLLDSKDLFLSKGAGSRFLGYMTSQRAAMTGERNKRTNRPELIHTFGYDTKFAYHMIRLGLQGIELMESGKIQMPMSEDHRTRLLDIRRGKMNKEEVLAWSFEIEEDLKAAITLSALPPEPDTGSINELLHHIYMTEWKDQK